MSFREKSAWITFVLLLVVFGLYFVLFIAHQIWPARPHPNFFVLFMVLLLVMIVIEVVVHILVAIRSPADAQAPQDERERLIALKAKRPAFYVLMSSAFLCIGLMHLGIGVWVLGNAIFFSVWLGELTNYGAQLYYYRRGT